MSIKKRFERIPNIVHDEHGMWKLIAFDPKEKASLKYAVEGDPKFAVDMAPSHVETDFLRIGRPEPKSKIIGQGKWECAASALAMLLNENLFTAKRAMGKSGWRNDDKGANDQVIVDAARFLGRDLIKINRNSIKENMGPAMITLSSLNVKGMGHAVTWTGEEILDPNWGHTTRKFWGCEWAPWTMKANNALVLLSFTLSQKEREELDKHMRKQEEDEVNKLKQSIIMQLAGNQ